MQHFATTQVTRPFESENDRGGHALQAEASAIACEFLRYRDASILRPEALYARRYAIYDGGHAVGNMVYPRSVRALHTRTYASLIRS